MFIPWPQAEAREGLQASYFTFCHRMARAIAGFHSHFQPLPPDCPHTVDFYGTVLDLKLFLNPLGTWVVGGKWGTHVPQ